MEIPILSDITIIFLFAALSLYAAGKLKIPEILGYLITGVLVGPKGFGLIHAVHEVEMMAEIGVVLLLFTIGIEFSLSTLLSLKRPAILGGALQVILTTIAFTIVGISVGYSLNISIFIALMGSLSSTAIVLKVLASRGEIDTPYGRIATAILIFQDIAVIPMMLITPVLAGQGSSATAVAILIGKAVVIVLFVFFGARTVVPRLLFQVASTKNRELFMITIVLVCLGVAWFTSKAGLSLALGAFLAGIVVSESGYGQQALGDVIPFKDVFTGFFFVSIGMLLDLSLVASQPIIIIGGVIAVIAIKFLVLWFTVSILGYPLRVCVQSAAANAISFFSFTIGLFLFIISSIAP
jgi:CPA2 family monovalent cation:H+ antiporter-2